MQAEWEALLAEEREVRAELDDLAKLAAAAGIDITPTQEDLDNVDMAQPRDGPVDIAHYWRLLEQKSGAAQAAPGQVPSSAGSQPTPSVAVTDSSDSAPAEAPRKTAAASAEAFGGYAAASSETVSAALALFDGIDAFQGWKDIDPKWKEYGAGKKNKMRKHFNDEATSGQFADGSLLLAALVRHGLK